MLGLVGYTSKLKWGTTTDRNLNKVCDLIDAQSNSRKVNLIRELFEETSAEAILSIPFALSNTPDTSRRIISAKGVYSIKDAYLNDQKFRFEDSGDLS